MALTVRTNGSGGSNIIQASWFNDYHDLLTGVMQDQEVTIKNNVVLAAIGAGPTASLAGVVAAGTTMGIGVYKYVYTWVSPDGETTASPSFSITTTSGNQKVNLSSIATGPVGTTARNVYRTKVGGTGLLKLTTISDNTTTTFSDTTADASLPATLPPSAPSFGGSLAIKDSSGTVRSRLNNDGSIFVAMTPFVTSGGTSGTATIYQWIQGTIKVTYIDLDHYAAGASAQNIALPVAYTNHAFVRSGFTPQFKLLSNGTAQSINMVSSFGTSGIGSSTAETTLHGYSYGEARNGTTATPFDTIQFVADTSSPGNSGFIIIEGV